MNNLDEISQHISNTEKRSQKCSRESTKYMMCQYLLDKIGCSYDGIVVNTMEIGLFITIPLLGCDGLCKTKNIKKGGWLPDVKNYKFINFNNESIKLGDNIIVTILNVNTETREIEFKIE